MKRPQWTLRIMFLTIAIVGIALVVLVLPAFGQPSNCGGTSEALNDVELPNSTRSTALSLFRSTSYSPNP
jgi:hypothetical protein